MTSLATFLMFEGKAEEAGRFYAGLFGAELANVRHHPDGKLLAADLSVAGQRLMLFDSTVEHAESRLVRRLFALNQV